MAAPMKNPAKRCNADGAVNVDPFRGTHMIVHSTLSGPEPVAAFVAGYSAYPFSFETGRRAAQLWLSAENPPLSLADFRENRWRAFSAGCQRNRAEHEAFSAGFSKALADHVAGVSHG